MCILGKPGRIMFEGTGRRVVSKCWNYRLETIGDRGAGKVNDRSRDVGKGIMAGCNVHFRRLLYLGMAIVIAMGVEER